METVVEHPVGVPPDGVRETTAPAAAAAASPPAAPVVAAPVLGEERPARTSSRTTPRSSSNAVPHPDLPATRAWTRTRALGWWGLLVVGVVLLSLATAAVGPTWLGGLGAAAVSTAYTWALTVRIGGRALLSSLLAGGVGLVVVATDVDLLRTGAAVLTAAAASVLGVMATVPAVRFRHAVRELVVALATAGLGAWAALGWAPMIVAARFEVAVLVVALAVAFGLVHRLGAGLHGLGRRGLAVVVVGGVLLTGSVVYAELLRRYGTPSLVESILDGVRWTRDSLGAVPRPLQAFLGVPALLWGCHMRARRRQGWWVCAFGVGATVPVPASVLATSVPLTETVLSLAYAALVGLVVGYAAIRADLALTGSRGSRARRAERDAAVRPEPARTQPLL